MVGSEVYSRSCLEDLDKFVPKDLTLRMVLRRKESFLDLFGKFNPILAKQSLLCRETAKASKGWNISMDLRGKWVKSFLTLEKLRGLKSNRAVMPRNTSSPKLNLITNGDIAKEHFKITTVREGVLTTVSELRLPKGKEEDFDEGFVHKLPPEILTKGHTVLVAAERKDKIAEDIEFSNYLLNSIKQELPNV